MGASETLEMQKALVPERFLHFKRFAGTRNSHFHCGSPALSAFQAFRWHPEFAFSLRFPSAFCISSVSLALEIRIFTAVPQRFLHFKGFAGTRNSHFHCGSPVPSAFQAFRWH